MSPLPILKGKIKQRDCVRLPLHAILIYNLDCPVPKKITKCAPRKLVLTRSGIVHSHHLSMGYDDRQRNVRSLNISLWAINDLRL